MEIPFSALVAVAVRYQTLYVDLLDKWCNSLRVGGDPRSSSQQLKHCSSGGGKNISNHQRQQKLSGSQTSMTLSSFRK
jgi:hypothetical protein